MLERLMIGCLLVFTLVGSSGMFFDAKNLLGVAVIFVIAMLFLAIAWVFREIRK